MKIIFLPYCIKSIEDYVDEIILNNPADTVSASRVKVVLEGQSWPKYDWFLHLSGNEVFYEQDLEELLHIIHSAGDKYNVITARRRVFWKNFIHYLENGYNDPLVILASSSDRKDTSRDKVLDSEITIPYFRFADNASKLRSILPPEHFYMTGIAETSCIRSCEEDPPRVLSAHPFYNLYSSYTRSMNKYMEEHWQFHNHLREDRHKRRITFAGKLCVGKTVEVGCADGFSTTLMDRTNSDASFSGVEPTLWAYNRARELYPGYTFYHFYAENLPFYDEEYDTVILPEIIEHVEDPDTVLKEAWRVCRRKLIVTAPAHPAGASCDPDHKRYFSREMMGDLCKRICSGVVKISFVALDKKGYTTPSKPWFGITEIYKR